MLEEKLVYHPAWCDSLKLRHRAFYQMGLQATLPLKISHGKHPSKAYWTYWNKPV